MKTNYDIIIIGGGFSGVAAAIAARREGADVLLVERYGFLGGSATMCLVNPFMPYTRKVNDKEELVNAGLFKMILERLEEMNALHSNRKTFNEEALKLLFDRLMKENKIDVLLHSYLCEVQRQGKSLKNVTVVNKSGKIRLEAKYFIDCSGDADLVDLCGCECMLGREPDNLCQPMTLCFRLANVDLEKFEKNREKINPLYQKFQREGKIKNPRENVLIFSHMSGGVLHFNSTRIVKHNPVDACDLTKAEITAREQVYELHMFMKNNIEGFENSTLIMSATQIGIRESRMIKGLYTITGDDLVNCVKFEDSIARGKYGIDIHSPDGSGTTIKHIPPDDYYTIPYRSLVPKGIDNLIAAGRCISSTHEAQSAYRVMPICCCIGEGAGTAAVLALKNGLNMANVPAARIQEILVNNGALV